MLKCISTIDKSRRRMKCGRHFGAAILLLVVLQQKTQDGTRALQMPARSKKSKAAKRRYAEGGLIAVDLGSTAEFALTRKKQVAEFALTRDKEVAEFALPRIKQVAEVVLTRHSQFGKECNKQCGAISLTAVLKSKINEGTG
ncbi:hypothetical protein N1851_026782 [Merluccius polli]|uniref:Uncharacterized protein n=1 Tax=Merluccius polli TaxID=89951 RepID=A0AA47NUV5_MERPO|nr:hypothetical protein N1851_026782 [Merluccius polli]